MSAPQKAETPLTAPPIRLPWVVVGYRRKSGKGPMDTFDIRHEKGHTTKTYTGRNAALYAVKLRDILNEAAVRGTA